MIVTSKFKLIKVFKTLFCVFTFLITVLSCSRHNVIEQSNLNSGNFSLSESEIKYLYHESVRRLFYEGNLLTLALRMNDFYNMKELDGTPINCGDKNFKFMVSDRIDNVRIQKYLNINKIDINERISVIKHLKKMEFYFQPKIYFANIDEKKVSLKPPNMGYFVFSDIFKSSNGLYYIEATLTSRLTCEDIKDLYTGWNYTFEIERCASGFLRFNKIIVGTGEASSAHGVISTVKILDDTYDCK